MSLEFRITVTLDTDDVFCEEIDAKVSIEIDAGHAFKYIDEYDWHPIDMDQFDIVKSDTGDWTMQGDTWVEKDGGHLHFEFQFDEFDEFDSMLQDLIPLMDWMDTSSEVDGTSMSQDEIADYLVNEGGAVVSYIREFGPWDKQGMYQAIRSELDSMVDGGNIGKWQINAFDWDHSDIIRRACDTLGWTHPGYGGV